MEQDLSARERAPLDQPGEPKAADPGAAGSSTDPPASAKLASEVGPRFGRYVVLDRIGAGGMGVVYAAYDPSLDRKVALKLLRQSELGSFDTRARGRLIREAKALARLSHPNVVHVYDVGTVDDDQVYVAMEFIDGETLRSWQEGAIRPRSEVLARYLAAGEGLRAAHEAGLV